MKRSACIPLLVFVMFLCGCGVVITEDEWNHFAFSASASSVITSAGSEPWESVSITTGLGLMKEIYDCCFGTGFSTRDLTADLTGAVLGAAAAEVCVEDSP